MSIRTEVLMGTTVTIDTATPDTGEVARAFDWFHTVEQICTRFDPQSELCQLTARPGMPVPVSRVLFEALRFAVHVAEATEGAFDPTIGGVLHQRGFNREHRSGQTVAPLVDPVEGVSFRDVDLDAEHLTITLRRPLLLDLGAVAKGMAIDLAVRELAGCRNFAIDAGGDLYLGGHNDEGRPWSIGIRHPRAAGACIAAVHDSNQAECTSGDYERRVPERDEAGDRGGQRTARAGGQLQSGGRQEDDARGALLQPDLPHQGHHLIDPRTGTSPSDVASVTVIAASAMLADALATAAFVLGPRDGLTLLTDMGVEGLIVTADLEQIRTSGWPGE